MMPREKSRFLTFILVFNSFCRLPSSSLLNWKVLSSTTATANASSLPIMRFLRPPPWKKWLSCVHFFLNICRKSQKSTRRRRLFLTSSPKRFFKIVFKILWVHFSLVARFHKHSQSERKPSAADRQPNSFPITYCHALSQRDALESIPTWHDIHHICRVQIYVTTRAFYASHVYTFLIWFSSFRLGNIVDDGKLLNVVGG